jgi:hypothetical protein
MKRPTTEMKPPTTEAEWEHWADGDVMKHPVTEQDWEIWLESAGFEKHPAHRRRQADRRVRAGRRRASLRTGRGEGLMTAPTMPVRIIARNANWLQAVRDGQVVAAARRKNKGTLWYVTLREHAADTKLSRAATPHVRISGKLPEDLQRQLLRAVLEAS